MSSARAPRSIWPANPASRASSNDSHQRRSCFGGSSESGSGFVGRFGEIQPQTLVIDVPDRGHRRGTAAAGDPDLEAVREALDGREQGVGAADPPALHVAAPARVDAGHWEAADKPRGASATVLLGEGAPREAACGRAGVLARGRQVPLQGVQLGVGRQRIVAGEPRVVRDHAQAQRRAGGSEEPRLDPDRQQDAHRRSRRRRRRTGAAGEVEMSEDRLVDAGDDGELGESGKLPIGPSIAVLGDGLGHLQPDLPEIRVDRRVQRQPVNELARGGQPVEPSQRGILAFVRGHLTELEVGDGPVDLAEACLVGGQVPGDHPCLLGVELAWTWAGTEQHVHLTREPDTGQDRSAPQPRPLLGDGRREFGPRPAELRLALGDGPGHPGTPIWRLAPVMNTRTGSANERSANSAPSVAPWRCRSSCSRRLRSSSGSPLSGGVKLEKW